MISQPDTSILHHAQTRKLDTCKTIKKINFHKYKMGVILLFSQIYPSNLQI